jgi:two-component system, response regulator PdtaR
MLTGKRLLVVEGEFLVALDMQRILEEANASSLVFARSIVEAASLSSRFREWDLAIVELQRGSPTALLLIKELLAAGVAVVATSADPSIKRTVPGFQTVPVLNKPFGDAELLTACTVALALSDGRG